MQFTPHTLEIYIPGTNAMDEKKNPIVVPGTWQEVCKCRCDDNGAQQQIGVNGISYTYSYKVVFAKRERIESGTKIRILNEDGTVRAEGDVTKPGETNMLNYSYFYL